MKKLNFYKRPVVDIPQTITGLERSLIEAFNDKRIHETEKKEVIWLLEDEILKSYFTGGFKRNPDEDRALAEDTLLANDCYIFLSDQHRFVTLSEIRIIINNGARGIYGDNFGINPAAFTRWVNKYLSSKEVNDAKEEYGRLLKQRHEETIIRTVPAEAEVEEGRRTVIVKAFKEYQVKRTYEDYGSYVYDSLDKMKLIPFTKKEKNEFLIQAITTLRVKLITKLSLELNKVNRSRLKDQIKELESDEIQFTLELKAEAKRLCLYTFFDILLSEKCNIEDWL